MNVVLVIVSGAALLIVTPWMIYRVATTSVELASDNIKVRDGRTKSYPYSAIVDARIYRGTNDRQIRLELDDGTTVLLPAPTRGLDGAPSQRLLTAERLIRERCQLPAVRPLP